MDVTALLVVLFGLAEAVTIVVAAQGELLTEKSGILNIGIEGCILLSAFSAAAVDYTLRFQLGTWAPEAGLLAGVATGMAVNFAFSVMSAKIHVDQVVAGIGINVLGLGLTYVFLALWFKLDGTNVNGLAPTIHQLFFIPGVTRAFGGISALEIFTFVLPILVFLLLNRTKFGLHVRAVGENPKAAEAAGINVANTRIMATTIGGALLGLAGSYITVELNTGFTPDITNGIGFVALAAVIAGGWTTSYVLGVGVLFGVMVGSGNVFEVIYNIPTTSPAYYFLQALPYLITVVTLAILAKRLRPPASLALPYKKE